MKIEKIVWEDITSYNYSGISLEDAKQSTTLKMTTVGIVIKSSKKYLRVAWYCDDLGKFAYVMVIPKANVISRKVIGKV